MVLKLVYLFMMIFLFSSFASALEYRTNQYFYLNLTNGPKDERGNKDFTVCASSPSFSSSGADFELSESDCINANPSTELLSSGSKSFGYCMKVVPESLTATMIVYDEHQDSSNTGHILRIGDSGAGVYKFNVWYTGGSGYIGNALAAGSGYNICFSFNESNNQNRLYVNSTTSVQLTGDITDGTGTALVHAARYSHTTAGYYDGIIKEFCGWRNTTTGKVLTQSDVSTYLSYGCDGTPPAAPAQTFTLKTSLINSTLNWNEQHFNYTYNATCTNCVSDIVNITFFNNGKKNITYSGINISRKNRFNVTLPSTLTGWYNFSFNISNSNARTSSSVYEYKVDLVKPVILSSFINNSNITITSTQSFYVNFTDANLYAYNITWFQENIVIKNLFVQGLTSNFYANTSTFPIVTVGNYSIRGESWDSHTAIELSDSAIQLNSKEIDYKDIKITSDSILLFKQNIDKISFTLDKGASYLCYETTGNWIKIQNSEYPNHYIDFKNKVWVDDYINKLVLVSNNKLCTESIKSLEINSIGDLNYEVKTYYFTAYEEASLSDALLAEISQKLTNIYNLLNEVLNMLWLVILYLGLLYFSFWVVKSGNVYTGIAMLITTIGFDFYFVQKIYTDFVLPNSTDVTYVGKMSLIFGVLLVLWIFAKIGFVVFSRYSKFSKNT